MLNLGTQLEEGTTDDSFQRYKSGAVAVFTVTLLVAIALIIVGIVS
jgi:hypothetical protein